MITLKVYFFYFTACNNVILLMKERPQSKKYNIKRIKCEIRLMCKSLVK